jgi:hypothetical protein
VTPPAAPSFLRPPARERLTTRVLAVAGVLAVLVLGVWVLFLGVTSDLRAAAELERRSSEATAAAAEVEKLAVDLETGLRGYLLTRDERFLQPSREARAALPSRMDALEGLVARDSRQRRAVRAVHSSIDELAAYQRGLIAAGLRGAVTPRQARRWAARSDLNASAAPSTPSSSASGCSWAARRPTRTPAPGGRPSWARACCSARSRCCSSSRSG